MLHYELFKSNEIVTVDRDASRLNHLIRGIDRERLCTDKGLRKVILLDDNARPRVALVTRKTLMDFEWEIPPHPTYNPDITPSDYHIFPSMQRSPKDSRFKTETEEIWIDNWIAFKDESFFRRGIHILPERWAKVVESEGHFD